MTPDSQVYLASLIRYYHRGSIALFGRMCDLAGIAPSVEHSFTPANLLLANELVGLVDVRHANGYRAWWAASAEDVVIRGSTPKAIGTTLGWFKRYGENCRPLVTDSDGRALALGSDVPDVAELSDRCDFGARFVSRLPSLRDVERLFVREEAFRHAGPVPTTQTQIFSTERRQWLADLECSVDRELIRTRDAYSGWRYEILVRDAGLRFVVSEPEWAFLLAANILGWDVRDFVNVTASGLRVSTAFRLPTLLLRYIFANSNSATLGAQINFEGVASAVKNHLVAYVTAGRRLS